MKWLRFCIIAALILLAAQCMAVNAVPDLVKYSQLPNHNWSYDLSSEIKPVTGASPLWETVMADDWKCNATGTVCDIHWWGSYWTPPPHYTEYSDALPNAVSGGIQGFNITIWDDVPASPNNPYSHPGTTKIKEIPITGNANEQWAFDVPDPPDPNYQPHSVYKYDVNLSPNEQFPQTAGTTYWLSIQAILPDASRQWGWHETTGIQPGTDTAVIQKSHDEYWYIPCGGHDMAFELTTVPEPSGILALITGLSGVIAIGLKRRR